MVTDKSKTKSSKWNLMAHIFENNILFVKRRELNVNKRSYCLKCPAIVMKFLDTIDQGAFLKDVWQQLF